MKLFRNTGGTGWKNWRTWAVIRWKPTYHGICMSRRRENSALTAFWILSALWAWHRNWGCMWSCGPRLTSARSGSSAVCRPGCFGRKVWGFAWIMGLFCGMWRSIIKCCFRSWCPCSVRRAVRSSWCRWKTSTAIMPTIQAAWRLSGSWWRTAGWKCRCAGIEALRERAVGQWGGKHDTRRRAGCLWMFFTNESIWKWQG